MTVNATVDLRPLFGPARDQGQRPTCLAFATSDAHAALRGAWAALSCEFVFFHAQRRGKRSPKDGATLPKILEAVREDGQPAERGWPYMSAVPTDLTEWVPPATATPVFRRAGAAVAAGVDAIINELTNGRPVIALMRLSPSFYRVPAAGIVDEAAGEKPDLNLRHAVVAVGHGIAKDQRVVLVRNSWGNRWGMQGYAWLTESYLQPRVFRLGHLKEDLSVSPGPLAA